MNFPLPSAPIYCYPKCSSKCRDARIAVCRIFVQGFHEHLLNGDRKSWNLLAQRWRGDVPMLIDEFFTRTLKRTTARKPLVDNHSNCILVTLCTRGSVYLLRGHVGK